MAERDPEFSTAYTAGLLDGLGWLRFDFSRGTGADTYHVRPELRFLTNDNEYIEGILYAVLTNLGIDDAHLRLAEPSQGNSYVAVSTTAPFTTLREALRNESALLIERLAFVAETLGSHVHQPLSPAETVAYLQAADELRHGWTPIGRQMSAHDPEKIASDHGIAPSEVPDLEMPTPDTRIEPSPQYIGGVTDAICQPRLSIADAIHGSVGYSVYPQLVFRRAGVHPQFTRQMRMFLDDNVGGYESGESVTDLRIDINGATRVGQFVESVVDATYAKYEWLAHIGGEILPLFENDAHRTKQGFYEILRRFEPIYQQQDVERERKYTPAYFAEEWSDELDLADRE